MWLIAFIGLLIVARWIWTTYCSTVTAVKDIATAGEPQKHKRSGAALVAGASISGLLAARVLADHFETVILIEPEQCFADSRPRSRVRQHDQVCVLVDALISEVHLFLALLLPTLEKLFPTFRQGLSAHGGTIVAPAPVSYRGPGFAKLPAQDKWPVRQLYTSREAFEGLLRRLVWDLPNVTQQMGSVVAFQGHKAVQSVTIRRLDGRTEEMPVSMLIDATGTTNSSIAWLRKAGFSPPIKRAYDPKIKYTAFTFNTSAATRSKFDAVSPRPWAETGHIASAFVGAHATSFMRIDGNRVRTLHQTIIGEDAAPGDVEDYRQLVQHEPYLDWSHRAIQILFDAPINDGVEPPTISHMTVGATYRLEFDTTQMPDNLIVLGDSALRVNPIMGQGCTKAAIDALTLDHILRRGQGCREFVRLHYARTDGMWNATRTHDYAFAVTVPVAGESKGMLNTRRRWMSWFGYAATVDEKVGAKMAEIAGQLTPFASLFLPPTFARAVLAHLLY